MSSSSSAYESERLYYFIIGLKLSHLKGSREKQKKNVEKNLSCRWEMMELGAEKPE